MVVNKDGSQTVLVGINKIPLNPIRGDDELQRGISEAKINLNPYRVI